MQSWQLQAAKARFSEVVKSAGSEGPQEITVHGKPVAVVLSHEHYQRLSGTQVSLLDFMQRSPLKGLEHVEFERSKSPPRNVDL